MTRDDFLLIAKTEDIRFDAFNLDGEGNECYAVARHHGRWVVYYSERGLERNTREFLTESSALECLLELLRADPTTRL
jgi:hypothetical protein